MKTLILILFTIPIFSQVGIGTTDPQNDLHVSGGILVEDLPYLGMGSILIADEDGNIGRLNCPNCPPPWETQFRVLIQSMKNQSMDLVNDENALLISVRLSYLSIPEIERHLNQVKSSL